MAGSPRDTGHIFIMNYLDTIIYDSRKYILRNQGYFFYSGRKPWIGLEPGTLYTNRRNLQPEVYMMDECVPKLLGQWPSFWHYPPLSQDSPRASGQPLVGGKGAPLMYTGECLTDDCSLGWLPNQYFVFLCSTNKVLIERKKLWQLKKFRLIKQIT